jgi:hypothetical protein
MVEPSVIPLLMLERRSNPEKSTCYPASVLCDLKAFARELIDRRWPPAAAGARPSFRPSYEPFTFEISEGGIDAPLAKVQNTIRPCPYAPD